MATGAGTKDDPWVLQTPSLTSTFQMYRDESADPPCWCAPWEHGPPL